MKKSMKVLITVMVMVLSMGLFAGCGSNGTSEVAGTLVLKVNPEFEVNYDAKGNVVSVMPINEDAGKLMELVEDYQGKPAKEVVPYLVQLMEQEGYIKGAAAGQGKDINIEVKYGSVLPDDDFLDDIISNLKVVFNGKEIAGQVIVSGESNYGYSSYDVSDYGDSAYGSNYGSNTDYGSSVYDSNSPYDSDSPYEAGSPYEATSPYDDDNNSDYDSDSGYDASDYDD